MTLLRITIRAAALIFLLVAGVRVALVALYAGNPALALVAGPLTVRVSTVRAAGGDDDVNLDDEGTQNGSQGR